MKWIIYLCKWMLLSALLISFTGCSEDTTQSNPERFGFVQFRVMKNGTVQPQTLSRADGEDRLDSLSQARKIKVVLVNNGTVIEQTMVLTAASDDLGEYGLRSEKLRLMAGDYTLTGYELYGNVDQLILSGEPAQTTLLQVTPGGLTSQLLAVNTVPRGLVTFSLRSDLSQIETPGRAAADRTSYQLRNVAKADVEVHNKNTGEYVKIEGMRAKIEYYYDQADPTRMTSRSVCDTIVPLKAGRWEVTSYTVYNTNKKLLEFQNAVAKNEFIVADNGTTEAAVPVTMYESDGHIKDGFTLKKLWEALDGPNWSFRGIGFPKGCNWNFNRDVDLWTAQPGVQVLSENGRVASLVLSGFGAKGPMPECLGDLTELRALNLGSSMDRIAESPINTVSGLLETGGIEAVRDRLHEIMTSDYGLTAFAPEMRYTFSEEQNARIKASEERKSLRAVMDNDPDNYMSGITSLPESIGNLKNLKSLFIAYAPISGLPEAMKDLEKCTDMEIYGCLRLKEFPMSITHMPALTLLSMSYNTNIPSEEIYKGLQGFAANDAGKSLQGLYFSGNNTKVIPDLRSVERLRLLICNDNKIERFEAPFGKEHAFSDLQMARNRISELPRDAEGYFFGFDSDVETIDFSGNLFTELPDIFKAESIYRLGTVDFSNNRISSIENAAEGIYKGIRTEIFNLGFNRLPKFPKCIFNSGSAISYLMVTGNGMTEFETDALKGDGVINLSALDLARNCFKEMPRSFHNGTFPYMTGLDMSHNRFDAFPFIVLDIANLQTLILKGQRDEEGYRCLKQWPGNVGAHHGLRQLFLGSNDIRLVEDKKLSYKITVLDISDNPNIVIDVTALCPYIKARVCGLLYDPSQDIRGCDALVLDK